MFNSSEVGFQNAGVAYDEENRLTSIAGVLTNTWSGRGQRAYRSDASGNLIFFIYDGGMVVDELTSTGSVHAGYAYGPFGLIERYDANVGAGVGFAFDLFGSPTQRWYETSQNPLDLAVFDAGGEIISDTSAESGYQLTEWDPISAFGQWGSFTDEQTRAVGKSGWLFSGDRYYDVASGRYLTRDERFPSPYQDGDDGSAVISTFQTLGMVPLLGAPFNVAMGAYDVRDGAIGMGAIEIAGGFLDGVPEVPMGGALGAIAKAEEPASAMLHLATEGEELANDARAPLKAAETIEDDLAEFQYARQYGLESSYNKLRRAIKKDGMTLHAHHLIEKRFSRQFGLKKGDMLSMALTPDEHKVFTRLWCDAIHTGNGTRQATREEIENAAKRIYENYPSILRALGLVK